MPVAWKPAYPAYRGDQPPPHYAELAQSKEPVKTSPTPGVATNNPSQRGQKPADRMRLRKQRF